MNRYIMIRRLRWPVILLLAGSIALLHQMGVIPRAWHLFWPLALIVWGVLLLAERMALASEGYDPFYGTPWCGPGQAPQPGPFQGTYPAPHPGATQPTTGTPANPGTAIVPSGPSSLENPKEGGQS